MSDTDQNERCRACERTDPGTWFGNFPLGLCMDCLRFVVGRMEHHGETEEEAITRIREILERDNVRSVDTEIEQGAGRQ